MNPTILIVEDDRTIAYMVERYLKSKGFQVKVAYDGQEGWEAFLAHRPDVIVSDIKMPKMDGVELLEKIKTQEPKTDVILLTGHGDLSSAKRAIELGAYYYLEKPIFDISDLVGVIDKALEKQRLVRDRELVDRIIRDLSSRLNLSDLLDRFLMHLLDTFEQIDLAIISGYDSEHDQLIMLGTRGVPDLSSMIGMKTSKEWSVGAQAFSSQKPVLVDIKKTSLELNSLQSVGLPSQFVDLAHKYPNIGVLGVPIINKEKSLGSLAIISFNSIGEFDEHLINLLSTLCLQIGLYMENARLFENLQAQTGRLKAVIDNSMDGMVLVDPFGKLVMSNSRFNTLFPQDSPSQQKFFSLLQNSLQNEQQSSFTFTLDHPTSNEPTTLEVFATRVKQDGESVGIVANLRDVTFLRSADRNRTLILDLARHEIGTPLDAIGAHADILIEHWDQLTKEQRTEALKWIGRQSKEIKKMISETLAYSKIKEELLVKEQKPLNFSQVAEELAREIQVLTTRKGSSFSSNIEPNLWVIGNLTLKQAFRNLLENARRFTPAGGRINWYVSQQNGKVVAIVEDNGPGIPEDELESIFEPYYRGSLSKELAGTGLGLSITSEVIAAHRGRIQVDSVESQGSCFTVTLMATPPPG